MFLDNLLFGEHDNGDSKYIKRDSIVHAIVSSIRPKCLISTLQLAVDTYIYRKSGSKMSINLFAKLGVCVSYL